MEQSATPPPPHERLAWAPLIACFGLLCLGTAAVAAVPRAGEPVALFFTPWHDDQTLFDRVLAAGGTPIGFGAVPGIVVVAPTPDQRKLRASGAWLAIDASLTAALCITK